MSVWGSQVKKEQQARKAKENAQQQRAEEIKKHVHMDHNDAALLIWVLDALEGVQKEKAQDILVNNPGTLLSLCKPKFAGDALTSPLTCPYALHAIIIPLVGSDYKAILDTMEDNNIRILSNCIDIAIKYPRPSNFVLDTIKRLESDIENHKATFQTTDRLGNVVTMERPLTESELIYKQRELRAKKVESQFVFNEDRPNSDIWAETVEDLNKLSAAVDAVMLERGIDKTASVSAASDEKEEVVDTEQPIWPIKKVAEKLGTTPKKVYHHISRCLTGKNQADAAKINELFVFKDIKDGKKQVSGLRESCFEEYKKLFGQIRPYNRKPKEVKEPTNAEPKKTVVAQAPVAQPQKDGLLGVTALHAFLDSLVALLEKAKAELEAANNDYAKTFDALGKASNQAGRSLLIAQLGVANTASSDAQSKVDDLEKRINDGNAALKAKENADQAASAAQENLDKAKKELNDAKKAQKDANAMIAAILANAHTTQK